MEESYLFLINTSATMLWLSICLLLLLILSSALIAGSEVAFFSLDHNIDEKLEDEDSASANRILHLRSIPEYLLATILISNNFINVSIVIVSDYILWNTIPIEYYNAWAERILTTFNIEVISQFLMARAINFLFTVVGVTFILVLFGEIVPKIYARINNLNLARLMSFPLTILSKLFYPFTYLMVNFTDKIEARLDKNSGRKSSMSREEIEKAIELTVYGDKNAQEEVNMLKSIVKFGNVTVKQVMKSRVDVVALDSEMEYEEVMNIVKNSGFSRLPVFKQDFDNVIGILYVKDLILYIDKEPENGWLAIVRTDILYVPESKKISDLLEEFQEKHLHLAIVVDEFGGSLGIVTLEDVMEEVIGEIRDEFDVEEETDYVKLNKNAFIFEGKTLLHDLCRIMEIPEESFDKVKGEADTVAGMILEWLGRLPTKGQEIKYGKYHFTIENVNPRRIERIKIMIEK